MFGEPRGSEASSDAAGRGFRSRPRRRAGRRRRWPLVPTPTSVVEPSEQMVGSPASRTKPSRPPGGRGAATALRLPGRGTPAMAGARSVRSPRAPARVESRLVPKLVRNGSEHAGKAVAKKKPEQTAREGIDGALAASGWLVQDADQANLAAGRGVAVREFPLATGHGYADYALFVDGKAAGTVEGEEARRLPHRRRGPG